MSLEMFDGIQNNATGDGILFYFNPILFSRYSKPQVHDSHQSKENDDTFDCFIVFILQLLLIIF